MPLSAEQTRIVLRQFTDYVSSRTNPSADPVTLNKQDILSAIAAVDARVDAVLPSILNQVPQSFTPAQRSTLVRFVIRERTE